MKKIIVIGLDGLEPKIVSEMLAKGELPNLASLQEQGGYSPVQTTSPAQTPVAWSTFATGTNPGAHGIFDFVTRNPKNYLPDLALNRFQRTNSFMPPKLVNMRRGTPVWNLLSDAGIASTILRCPCTHPPDKIRGNMLAGLGVPDLRGGLGTSTFYCSDDSVTALESENVLHVNADSNDLIKTHLLGPLNPKGGDFKFDISLELNRSEKRLVVKSKGQPKALEVREGQWSDWLQVKFKQGPLQYVRGTVRFYLVSTAPKLELYASPINYDPNSIPLYPISSPPEYAKELAGKIGTFYTTGMVEDHGGLNNGRIDEEAFLQQCDIALREREQMMLHGLERLREGLFFCLFDTPDRVQHMFWRFRESDHPANQRPFNPELSKVIENHYRACDTIVGKAMQYVDDDTLFIALSDHGFNSFQRGVNVNTWLCEHGFLKLRNGMKPGEENGEFFPNVDWGQTKAYALGLSGIYLNLRGREEKGCVRPDEAESVRTAISSGLTGLMDEARNETSIRSVRTREQIYTGACASASPDLIVNFNARYRVSWETALGGVPQGLFADNTRKWSGDHCIDPALVPGVLFMNKPFKAESAGLVDLAPTILAAFGAPKGAAMEGDSLLHDHPTKAQTTGFKPLESEETPPATPEIDDDEARVKERLKGLGYI